MATKFSTKRHETLATRASAPIRLGHRGGRSVGWLLRLEDRSANPMRVKRVDSFQVQGSGAGRVGIQNSQDNAPRNAPNLCAPRLPNPWPCAGRDAGVSPGTRTATALEFTRHDRRGGHHPVIPTVSDPYRGDRTAVCCPTPQTRQGN